MILGSTLESTGYSINEYNNLIPDYIEPREQQEWVNLQEQIRLSQEGDNISNYSSNNNKFSLKALLIHGLHLCGNIQQEYQKIYTLLLILHKKSDPIIDTDISSYSSYDYFYNSSPDHHILYDDNILSMSQNDSSTYEEYISYLFIEEEHKDILNKEHDDINIIKSIEELQQVTSSANSYTEINQEITIPAVVAISLIGKGWKHLLGIASVGLTGVGIYSCYKWVLDKINSSEEKIILPIDEGEDLPQTDMLVGRKKQLGSHTKYNLGIANVDFDKLDLEDFRHVKQYNIKQPQTSTLSPLTYETDNAFNTLDKNVLKALSVPVIAIPTAIVGKHIINKIGNTSDGDTLLRSFPEIYVEVDSNVILRTRNKMLDQVLHFHPWEIYKINDLNTPPYISEISDVASLNLQHITNILQSIRDKEQHIISILSSVIKTDDTTILSQLYERLNEIIKRVHIYLQKSEQNQYDNINVVSTRRNCVIESNGHQRFDSLMNDEEKSKSVFAFTITGHNTVTIVSDLYNSVSSNTLVDNNFVPLNIQEVLIHEISHIVAKTEDIFYLPISLGILDDSINILENLYKQLNDNEDMQNKILKLVAYYYPNKQNTAITINELKKILEENSLMRGDIILSNADCISALIRDIYASLGKL